MNILRRASEPDTTTVNDDRSFPKRPPLARDGYSWLVVLLRKDGIQKEIPFYKQSDAEGFFERLRADGKNLIFASLLHRSEWQAVDTLIEPGQGR